MNPFDISGKNIVITGGKGFLGQQWTKYLLENDANIEIWDLPEKDIRKRNLPEIELIYLNNYIDALICAAGAAPVSSRNITL